MKKLIAFILCILICVSFVACEQEETDKGGQALSGEKISSTNDDDSDTSPSHSSSEPDTRKKASDAYKAVLSNAMTLRNSSGKDVYFQDILRINTYESANLPQQSAVDMDGDKIEEFIIKDSYRYRTIVLHYEKGIVYGFEFDSDTMQYIYKDGAFYWIHYSSSFGREYGVSKISFEGEKLKFQELCRNEGYSKYYVGGTEVTQEVYQEFMNDYTLSDQLEFKEIDISLFNEGKALELASKHWDIKQGEFDEENGYRYRMTVYKDGNYYRVCLYHFVNNTYYEHIKCLWVNIDTGAVSIPNQPHAKG